MICRALGFAAVLLLVCGELAAVPAQAQENLDAGKSPSQLFAGSCSACHKSPRGLLKTIPAGSLQGFLRQHYTTSPEMAGVLAGYLVSNGAEAAAPSERAGRRHRAKSDAEPAAAAPEAGADAEKPHGRHGHRSTKHKHGSDGGEAAKPNAATEPSDAAKPAAEDKPAASSAGSGDPAAPAAH